MERTALAVVFNQGRDEELAALRARVAELTAERWDVLCRAGVRLCELGADESIIRCLVADFIMQEGWCLAEGVTGRFDASPGRLNFNANSRGMPLHIESLLVNRLTGDLRQGVWHGLSHYFRLIERCGLYSPGEGLFYQGSAPPRAAEDYNVW